MTISDWIKKTSASIAQVGAFLSPFAVVIGIVFAGYFWADSRYVHKDPDFSVLEQRLDIKIKSDFLQQTNARIWTLEDRLKQTPNDVTANEELRRLREEKNASEAELLAIKNSITP